LYNVSQPLGMEGKSLNGKEVFNALENYPFHTKID